MTALPCSPAVPRFPAALFLVSILTALAGCTAKPGAGGTCNTTSDCKSGLSCYLGVCAQTCKQDSDCGSGQACGAGYCEQSCTAQTDCLDTFACVLAAATDSSPTCYPVQYQQPDAGGFGTDCAAYSCGDAGPSPCATGFVCASETVFVQTGVAKSAKCDPNAICTTTGCTGDQDCPANFYCAGANYPYADGGMGPEQYMCAPRVRCDPCVTDDACNDVAGGGGVPGSYVCAHDTSDAGYCAKTCNSDTDCLHPYVVEGQTATTNIVYGPFETCQTDFTGTKVCTPTTGACYGKSAVPAITGTDAVCSPCRPGFPQDCDQSKHEVCLENSYGEWDCTVGCTLTLTVDSNQNSADLCEYDSNNNVVCWSYGADSCPTGSYCFFGGEVDPDNDQGGCATGCMAQGICTADSTYQAETCYLPDAGG